MVMLPRPSVCPSQLGGLAAQGTTGYANSLFQTLYMTPEFRRALYEWEYNVDVHGEEDDCIPLQLQRLFGRLQLDSARAASPEGLNLAMVNGSPDHSYEAATQQTIQDFNGLMFDALRKVFDAEQLGAEHPVKTVIPMFRGTMSSYVECVECRAPSEKSDDFFDLSLVIKPFGSDVAMQSVGEAIAHSLNPEILDGDNQYFCEKCQRKNDARKGLRLTELPYLLTLQLKRFDFDYERLTNVKLNDKVAYPAVLDMNDYLEDSGGAGGGGNASAPSPSPAPTAALTDPNQGGDAAPEANMTSSEAGGTSPVAVSGAGTDVVWGTDEHNAGAGAGSRDADAGAGSTAAGASRARALQLLTGPGGEARPWVYELSAVLVHSGAAEGGYYYAYCKTLAEGGVPAEAGGGAGGAVEGEAGDQAGAAGAGAEITPLSALAARPPSPPPPPPPPCSAPCVWACSVCTFENKPDNARCEMCDQPAPVAFRPPAPAPAPAPAAPAPPPASNSWHKFDDICVTASTEGDALGACGGPGSSASAYMLVYRQVSPAANAAAPAADAVPAAVREIVAKQQRRRDLTQRKKDQFAANSLTQGVTFASQKQFADLTASDYSDIAGGWGRQRSSSDDDAYKGGAGGASGGGGSGGGGSGGGGSGSSGGIGSLGGFGNICNVIPQSSVSSGFNAFKTVTALELPPRPSLLSKPTFGGSSKAVTGGAEAAVPTEQATPAAAAAAAAAACSNSTAATTTTTAAPAAGTSADAQCTPCTDIVVWGTDEHNAGSGSGGGTSSADAGSGAASGSGYNDWDADARAAHGLGGLTNQGTVVATTTTTNSCSPSC
jgi:ubiquitin C-terminal hydrolase